MEEFRYQQICNFLDGKLSATEKTALAQWRRANRENEKQFQEVKFLWQKAGLAKKKKAALKIDVHAALAKVHQQLPKTAKVIPLRRRLLKYVSAASVLLVLGLVTWMNFSPTVEMVQVATIANETKQISLPDNSTVWLNENSTISYPKVFAKATRNVSMEGDAIFEVTHNPQQPFVVATNDLTVKVLGTKFNVQSNNSETKFATVHVLHGKVQVQRKEMPSDKVILEKGMTALHDRNKNQLLLSEDFPINQLFWQTQTLSFDYNTLQEVLEDLGTAYNKEISITNPKVLTCLFTGIFEYKSLDEILLNLQLIYGFKIKSIDSQTLELNQGSCN